MNDMNSENYGSPAIFYSLFYKAIIFGKGIAPRLIRKTHQSIENEYQDKFFDSVLEIGGGVGEHLDFIRHDFSKYLLTDIKLPVLNNFWSEDPRVICQIEDAEGLSFPDRSFDRVIVTCLLHHVEKPEKVLNEIARVLKPNGVATIFLPCDPGLAVRTLRALTTAREAKKKGFQGYDLMIAREHRNHIQSLLSMTQFAFRAGRIKTNYYPFKLPSWNLNGFVIIHIR
jgi:SAM-dependent methyltransferase